MTKTRSKHATSLTTDSAHDASHQTAQGGGWSYRAGLVSLWLAMLGLPWLALSWPGLLALSQWPWAAAPYAFQSVVIVHLIGTLGFNLCATSFLVRGFASDRQWTLVGIGASVGLLVFFVSALSLNALRFSGLDFQQNSFLRLGWMVALQMPWAFALWAWMPRDRWWFQPNRVDGVIACLFALLPAMHAEQVATRHDLIVGEMLAYNQYLEAADLGRRLVVLGVQHIQEQDARSLVGLQERRVAALQKRVAQPLPANATTEDRLNRARELFSLSQVDAARTLLASLDGDLPQVPLYLGLAAELERDWNEAANQYGQAIDRLRKRSADSPDTLQQLKAAHERYANNLRRAGQPLKAEKALQDARREWPQIENALLLQLAYHYQMAGRIWESQDFFRQAVAADPSLKPEVDAELKKLDLQAQGCVLRPTRGVSR